MTDETLKENATHGKAERACKRCSGDIIGRGTRAFYCSEVCRKADEAARGYMRRKGVIDRPKLLSRSCAHCSKHFDTDLEIKIYCGNKCANASSYLRSKGNGTKAQNDKRHQSRHKEKYLDYHRKRDKKRMECKLFAMRKRLSIIHRLALRRVGLIKRSSTFTMLGYTPQDLADHLERQFVKGMTWDNRHKWHIDHIVPISTAETEADVIALNQLSNLRPIWAKDNLAKSDKRTHLI